MLRVKRASSLKVLCSLGVGAPGLLVLALNMEGVEMERSRDTRLGRKNKARRV